MKLHRTDGVSLAFGLVFLGAAGLWLVSRVATLDAATVGWISAAGLVLLGGIGLVQVAVATNRRDSAARHDTADPPGDPPA